MSTHHEGEAHVDDPPPPGPDFQYVRVKRKKTTWFIDVNLQGTVSELKANLQEAMGPDAPPKGLRLYLGTTELLDARTLVDYDVKDDDVLGVAFGNEDGTFEAVDIEEYTPTMD